MKASVATFGQIEPASGGHVNTGVFGVLVCQSLAVFIGFGVEKGMILGAGVKVEKAGVYADMGDENDAAKRLGIDRVRYNLEGRAGVDFTGIGIE